jgi:hypothetical protein
MAVPETAMHENHGVKARKNKVGRAREIFSMKTKAKAHFMDHPSNQKFRGGVLAANPSHPFAALNR